MVCVPEKLPRSRSGPPPAPARPEPWATPPAGHRIFSLKLRWSQASQAQGHRDLGVNVPSYVWACAEHMCADTGFAPVHTRP